MVGGFNTNIRYRGHIFHVQTEDGGKESPSIITLLYSGGAILFSRKTSYAEQADKPDREAVVRQMIEAQHSARVQALKTGKLDDKLGLVSPDAVTNPSAGSASQANEFGAGVVTRRSLDEVVLAHLASR
jgi:hypothetical protein